MAGGPICCTHIHSISPLQDIIATVKEYFNIQKTVVLKRKNNGQIITPYPPVPCMCWCTIALSGSHFVGHMAAAFVYGCPQCRSKAKLEKSTYVIEHVEDISKAWTPPGCLAIAICLPLPPLPLALPLPLPIAITIAYLRAPIGQTTAPQRETRTRRRRQDWLICSLTRRNGCTRCRTISSFRNQVTSNVQKQHHPIRALHRKGAEG